MFVFLPCNSLAPVLLSYYWQSSSLVNQMTTLYQRTTNLTALAMHECYLSRLVGRSADCRIANKRTMYHTASSP